MSVIRRVAVVVLCAVAFGFASAGCGGDSGVDVATAPKPAVPTEQVRRQLADPLSPASVVMRFWKSIQQGALPLSLDLYEPKVVSSVGITTFAGMLNEQRAGSQESRLNVLRTENVARGQLVTAETLPKVGSKLRHSFFLRRARGRRPVRWQIVYDTLSAVAIKSYVQSRTQRLLKPTEAPGRQAITAGEAAIDVYYKASLSRSLRSRRSTRAPRTALTEPATTTTPQP